METKNYMSIFGKNMSRCQLVLNMKYLRLDPKNPESIIIDAKKRRKSSGFFMQVNEASTESAGNKVVDDSGDAEEGQVVPPQMFY